MHAVPLCQYRHICFTMMRIIERFKDSIRGSFHHVDADPSPPAHAHRFATKVESSDPTPAPNLIFPLNGHL